MEEKEEKDGKQGINRRTFLTGTSAGLVALAVSSVLRPAAAFVEGSGKTAQGASGGMNTNKVWHGSYEVDMNNVNPIPTVSEPAKYDYETDVLILGYGVSGTQAALTVVKEGCRVIAMEKSSRHNWYEHAGVHTLPVPGVKEWRDLHGIPTWDEATVDKIISNIYPGGLSTGDREAHRTFLLAAPDAFEQIRGLGRGCSFERVDIFPEWAGLPTMIPTHDDLKGGSIYYPWVNKYHAVEHRINDYVQSKGGQVLWETPATNLITDNSGRVVGARGLTSNGSEVYVKAKAVIDCVGGMGANYDMIKYYGLTNEVCGCHVGPLTNDGSGMRMCQGAGAGVRGLPRCGSISEGALDSFGLGLPWTLPHDNAVTRAAGLSDRQVCAYTYAPIQIGRQPVLKTNKYGLRYMNENADWPVKTWASFTQPGQRYYTFYDGDIEHVLEQLNKLRYGMCERFITPDLYIYFDDDDIRPLYDWRGEFQDGIDKGYIVKADTLEELAEKLGVNSKNLIQTVERYNSFCDSGKDEDYGKDAKFLFPVRKPPFYGMERCAAYIWNAEGGVATDVYGRVLNEKGEVIPGLYCGSNDGQCTDHETYSNATPRGVSHGAQYALTMGYLAGKSAAADIKKG